MPSCCCSSSDFLQSHYTFLLSSFLLPFSCTSWCSCSFLCISQIPRVRIFSFSVRSFCRTGQEFLQWPRVFSLTMFAKDVTGCFNHYCVEGGDHLIHFWIFVIYDGERCKLPAYHILEGFQHIWIFKLFELACFGLQILFRQRWKVIISKLWSLPISAPGKFRVLAVFTPDRKRFLTRMKSIWLWCCSTGLCKVHLLDALWWPNLFASKVMLKIILNRLKPQAEKIIVEEQAGFRAGRNTTEQIFNLRILCEKYLQHQQDLYHVFIDFKKSKTGLACSFVSNHKKV